MNDFTDEQQEAIYFGTSDKRRVKHAAVSAAAGSGKTAVLTEHVAQLIKRGTDPARIAVMTFTEDAAQEIHDRVSARIAEISYEQNNTNSRTSLQFQHTNDINICTIHSFCNEIVRDYSTAAGLKPAFAIVDETEKKIMHEKALEAAISAVVNGELGESLDNFRRVTGGDTERLRELINTMRTYMSRVANKKTFVHEQMSTYDNPSEYFARIKPALAEKIRDDIAEMLYITEECQKICDAKHIISDLEMLENLQQIDIDSKDLIQRLKKIPVKFTTKSRISDPEIDAIIKAERENVKAIFKDVTQLLYAIPSFTQSASDMKDVVKSLFAVYEHAEKVYTDMKKAANVIDFDDMEEICHTLLTENAEIRQQMREYYDYIIVDEFQDSNNRQYDIFKALSISNSDLCMNENPSIDTESKNAGALLYFVGDIKQSIYAFRDADPDVFISVTSNPAFHTMYLRKNFRSGAGVIDGVNQLFKTVMTAKIGGVDYGENDALVCGSGLKYPEDCDYSTEIVCVHEKDKNEKDEKNAENEEIEKETLEPLYTARRIFELLNNKYKIYDKHEKRFRPCRYSDFAVITSVGVSNFPVYEQIFTKFGIPVSSPENKNFLSLSEIETALDILTSIDNPYNDLALLSTCMSAVFRFSADDMAEIECHNRSYKNDDRHVGKDMLFTKINRYTKSGTYEHIAEKCRYLLKILGIYRDYSLRKCSTALLMQMTEDGIFLPLCFGNRRRVSNLRLLTYYSTSFDEKGQGGLSNFLAYMRSLGNSTLKEAKAPDGNQNAVMLMTIHGSKGLEFPIVFVGRTHKTFRLRDFKGSVLTYTREFGLAIDFCDAPILYKSASCELNRRVFKERQISEEMRKLYVAATRARDKLIFTATLTEENAQAKKAPCNSFLYWIFRGEENGKKSGDKLKMSTYAVSGSDFNEENITHVVHTKNNEEQIVIPPPLPKSALPMTLTATGVGVKHDETRMVERENDEPLIFPRLPSFLAGGKLTGKLRGDAYHTVMELIDFTRFVFAGDDTLDEVYAQLDSITPSVGENCVKAVNPLHIAAFFQSGVGRRAAAAAVRGELYKEYKLFTQPTAAEMREMYGTDCKAEDSEYVPMIRGIADMFFAEDGQIVITDYKTNRNITPRELTEQYRNQLRIYARGLSEMTGLPVKEQILYSFEYGEIHI